MKLRIEQLGTHLEKGLAAIYVIHGDEPLLAQEAADAIRGTARAQGYGRECQTVDTSFNWDTLLQTSVSLSLFAARRILELRLVSAKLSGGAAQTLQAYAKRPPEGMVLLLVSYAKLDSALRNSSLLRSLDAVGAILQVWPVEASQLPAWIEQRMRAKGLQPTAEVATLLADRVEGNLLAAVQEIEKLHLLFGTSRITARQLTAVVGDSARYSVYDLVDTTLAAQAERSIRILHGLRSEGIEATLVAWALHREIRLLNRLSFELTKGESLEMLLTRNRIWEKRKPLLRRALQRLNAGTCRRLLGNCARLDRLVKGLEQGDPWEDLLHLSLCLAGQEVPKPLSPFP